MIECVRLRKKILGMDHPGSQSPIEALNDWQAGDANLFALLARILDLD
jgi:hypothetical protein